MNRREVCCVLGGALLAPSILRAAKKKSLKLNYTLSSALYGEMALHEILPEIARAGCQSIDIWRRRHGNQREQISEMGDAACQALLKKHKAKISVSTCYPLGPLGLQEEMRWLRQYGGKVIVTGSGRYPDKDPVGAAAKAQVKTMLEKLKPHVAKAEENGITIALENHSNQLLYHPDALRYFAEFNKSPNLGVAFAPHHLHAFESEIPSLIRDLGNGNIPFMYFQEHSPGIFEKVPKEIEMQQLPGYGGGLDYRHIVAALRGIEYTGLVEIFMHPVPRGIPILPTIKEVTAAINKSRSYIEECLVDTA
ncbi:MAG: sugar phosphate isomerase/epimerase [Candidatus Pelagisphaera sp.]|jgi:sugar phosphate isomerase/epimerase